LSEKQETQNIKIKLINIYLMVIYKFILKVIHLLLFYPIKGF